MATNVHLVQGLRIGMSYMKFTLIGMPLVIIPNIKLVVGGYHFLFINLFLLHISMTEENV